MVVGVGGLLLCCYSGVGKMLGLCCIKCCRVRWVFDCYMGVIGVVVDCNDVVLVGVFLMWCLLCCCLV